jgi:hypothetical protein
LGISLLDRLGDLQTLLGEGNEVEPHPADVIVVDGLTVGLAVNFTGTQASRERLADSDVSPGLHLFIEELIPLQASVGDDPNPRHDPSCASILSLDRSNDYGDAKALAINA